MPASRSRTERWRECLDQVYERNGGLEISLDRNENPTGVQGASHQSLADSPANANEDTDLIWRVRILGLNDEHIVIEQPGAMGQSVRLEAGTPLVVGMTIGQNRWMFRTTVQGAMEVAQGHARPLPAIRIAMPTNVERCQRRNFYRMSTVELRLPQVQCWPLLDLTSVVAAEVANRAMIIDLQNGASGSTAWINSDPLVLPEVGPPFKAKLVNIGGGGAGILVERGVSVGPDHSRALWVRIDLRPHIPAPIAMTGKISHTHIDSAQNMYLGLAFDFSFHTSHRDFVASQICQYVLSHQREYAQRRAG